MAQENGIQVRGDLAIGQDGGVVRITATVAAPVADVWAAVTEPDRLARWAGEITGDLRVGGGYHARLFPSGWDGDGRVLECVPGRRFLVESAEPGRRPTTDELTLRSEEPGRTVVVLTKRGAPVAWLAAFGVGVQIHVENLLAHLGGRPPVEPDAFWTALLPRYERLASDLGAGRG